MTPSSRNVAVYVVGRGEILKSLGGSDAFIALNTPEGCAVIDCPHGLNEHLTRVEETPEPHLVAREPFAVALPDEVDLGAVVTLPAPVDAEVLIDGVLMGAADEDGLEVEFASPGRYLVEIALWPYAPLRKRVRVD